MKKYLKLATVGTLLIMFFSLIFLQPTQAEDNQENTLDTIQLVEFVNIKKHKVKITWPEISGADQYQIRLLDENLVEIKQITADKNSKTIKELNKSTQYAIQIRAVNAAEEIYSVWSTEEYFYTKPHHKIKELPHGIKDDSLPDNVRMYENSKQADAAGAIKIALGDFYDDLIDDLQESAVQQSFTAPSTTRQIASGFNPFSFENMSDRARKQGKDNAKKNGGSNGEPHIQTFDGLKYDNQAKGVFWLVKDSNNDFSVQSIQQRMESNENASYNLAVAVQAQDHVVAFNLDHNKKVTLDGSTLNIIKNRVVVWPGAVLLRKQNNFLLITKEDQNFLIKLEDLLNPEIMLTTPRTDRYSGLLGNANNIALDDLSNNDTTASIDKTGQEVQSTILNDFMTDEAISFQMPIQTFYEDYIEPWNVSKQESYFAASDYINYFPPANLVRLDDFTQEEIQNARQECLAEARVEAANSLFGCVYDYLVAQVPIANSARIMKRADGMVEPTVWIDLK
ncbi:MAG: VWD domain-containing protein [Patescibacteria group bacterium]|jgi:hypothetical protein